METKTVNNAKLGIFVLAGLAFLVVLLYMIGKNISLFGSTFELKAKFENAQGLVAGNNVRYAGIQAGTVKSVRIADDTTLEVTMLVEKKFLRVIRKNAVVSIGTDGLVGNKVVNIVPSKKMSEYANDGEVLLSKQTVDTEEMLQTLYNTNQTVAVIVSNLKITVQRINESNNLWKLLNDPGIPANLRTSLASLRNATQHADRMTADLNAIVTDIKNGKGTAGAILRDSAIAQNLNATISKFAAKGESIDSLVNNINSLVSDVRQDINSGNGTLHTLLKSPEITDKLNKSLDNIQKGTEGFNQNMEALKHNFLFRGYFRKLEKEQARNANKATN
jgi:phospholipid/cholesterol/gamma-HCH transport system substrate-binding protein